MGPGFQPRCFCQIFALASGYFPTQGINGNKAWNFTAAAYNAGIGNILKGINMAESQDSLTWEEMAAVLPAVTGNASKETLRYVKRLQV